MIHIPEKRDKKRSKIEESKFIDPTTDGADFWKLQDIEQRHEQELRELEDTILNHVTLITNTAHLTLKGYKAKMDHPKSHTKGKLPGVVLAIEDLRRIDPGLCHKRKAIWNHLRDLATAKDKKPAAPWTLTKDGIRYEIAFRDRNTLIHKKTEKKGKTISENLTWDTFNKKYF
jgi:hypothetical protein